MKKKVFGFFSILLVFGIAVFSTSCDLFEPVKPNQTPVSGDYTIDNLNQMAKNVTAVTITPKGGKSQGAIVNICYSGSTTIPQTAGTYAVTFNVAADSGWNAATGLSAGTLIVIPETPTYKAETARGLVEFFFTNPSPSLAARARAIVNGAAYVIKLNGAVISSGTVTLIATEITFNPISGASFTGTLTTTLSVTIPMPSGGSIDVNITVTSNPVEPGGYWPGSVEPGGGVPGQFIITETTTTVTIIGYTGNGGAVTIPSTINGKPVIAIGDYSFCDIDSYTGKGVTSVTIPDSVTSMGIGAFAYNQLTSIVIPDSVTTIGRGAFAYNLLTNVTIPDSVTTIEYGAFAYNQLTSIVIPDSVTTIEYGAFASNQLTDVTIPNSVTALSGFNDNQLTSITIPISVSTIGEDAFLGNRLTSVTIPDSVVTIGDYAFAQNQLTSVTIPNSVTSIRDAAFYGNKLTSVTIPDSVTSIGNDAFAGNRLATVSIGNSVTVIGSGAFDDNDLTSVTIPNSVTTIGSNAFYGNQLISVTIPNGVTSIGRYAFDENPLTSVTIGANVTLGIVNIWQEYDAAFPNDFDEVYNNGGKEAGTYTRPDVNSTVWTYSE